MTNPIEIPGFIDLIGGLQYEDKLVVIKQAASRYITPMTSFLRDLTKIPGESTKEKEKILRTKQEMELLEFDEIIIDPMGNLLGFIGEGSKIIAFDAHIDTVGIGDRNNWSFDPYNGIEDDDIIGGRGTSDQAGGLVSAIYGARIIVDLELLPKDYRVLVVASVQEEDNDGLCWQYIINESKIRPEFVISTEPTDGGIYRGQRGRMEIKVEVKGISCHGSAPERGDNAIYKMAEIIKDIQQLNDNEFYTTVESDAYLELEMDTDSDCEPKEIDGLVKMLSKQCNPSWKEAQFLGRGTVTVSEVNSSSPSRCAVADGCVISLDRRMTAGETWESCLKEIKELPSVQKYNKDVTVTMYDYNSPSYTGFSYPIECYFPTWVLPKDHIVTSTLLHTHSLLFGEKRTGDEVRILDRKKRPLLDKWTFSTNGVTIMGRNNIPCIGFGPGAEEMAHAPDEVTYKQDLINCAAFYSLVPSVYDSLITSERT